MDVEKSEHKCKFCGEPALWVGLNSNGVSKSKLCTRHSYSSSFWGVWPIENDTEYGNNK